MSTDKPAAAAPAPAPATGAAAQEAVSTAAETAGSEVSGGTITDKGQPTEVEQPPSE